MTFIAKERNGKTTAFGKYGRLVVTGKKLTDLNGVPVCLRGISTHNLSLYDEYVNEAAFTDFADKYNISILRLAMYSANADDRDGYADSNDEHRAYLEDLIMKGVEICAKLGIYCLVDWHILLDYNPNMHKDMAIRFWKNICPKLKEYDNVILEICNEPNVDLKTGEQAEWKDITAFANEIIPVIRAIDDSKIIIVGTPVWSQKVDRAADSPLDYPNIMYTLHFYADSHKKDLRNLMHYALKKNLPIFVTEFGICNASGDGNINDEEGNIWIDELIQNDISYIMWNLSNKAETSSLLRSDCTKTSGFSDSDLSESGLRMKKYMSM